MSTNDITLMSAYLLGCAAAGLIAREYGIPIGMVVFSVVTLLRFHP